MKSSLKPDFNLPLCGDDKLCQDTGKLTRLCRFYLVLLARDSLGEGLHSLYPLTPNGTQLHFSDQRFSSDGECERFHARIFQGNAGKHTFIQFGSLRPNWVFFRNVLESYILYHILINLKSSLTPHLHNISANFVYLCK